MNLASETTPPCLLFLSIPVVSPLHSHLTSWSTINGNRVLSSTIAALSSLPKPRSQTPRLQNFGVVSRSSLHVDRTALTWTQPQQRESQWQRAYRRRPTPLETQDKTTEMEPRSPLPTVDACTVPDGRFPAKIGCQPIKSNSRPLAHTYPANYVRVHFSPLGVYKES